MKIRLDNYHTKYENGCLKVRTSGANIINKPCEIHSRKELMNTAYDEIERYNKENGLRWGVYFE